MKWQRSWLTRDQALGTGHACVEPYQDDHFFVSDSLGPRVRSCHVIDNEAVRVLSDHGPVELDIDL